MRFTKDHQWVELQDDGVASIGVTAYAAEQLGDVVVVQVPALGKALKSGEDMAVVESVKTASDLAAPIDGEVLAVNDALDGNPEMINEDPEGRAWIVKVRAQDPAQVEALMDRTAYEAFLDSL